MVDEKSKTLCSLDSKNNSESNTRVTREKRKSITTLESPRKRPRGAGRDTEVVAEANLLSTSGTKRKASVETGTPSKKQRRGHTDTNTGESTKVSVETHSNEHPPATESPSSRTSGCDPSLCSSSPSASTQDHRSTSVSVKPDRDFDAKYVQLRKLGEGGCGSVFAGTRKSDHLPVAIKRVRKAGVKTRPVVLNGNTYEVPIEVLLMRTAAGGPASVGESAAVTLLDWYDLDQEFVLVMERPVPSVDLSDYLCDNDGPLEEDQAKNIIKQLLEAAIDLHSEGVFHRDIKSENVLLEIGSDVPRVRVIDFGCGCFVEKTPYKRFAGTFAYAPPEFFIQGTYEAAPTTVWQLGALLYELLDGYELFTTHEYLRTRMKFIRKIKELNVNQDCHSLLRMCLAVNPKERASLEQMKLHPWFTTSSKSPRPKHHP